MSLTIELTAAEEAAIRTGAAREGTEIATFVREKVLHDLPMQENDLDFIRTDSLTAVRSAQQGLLDKGIGYVIARPDGTVVRVFPDCRCSQIRKVGGKTVR
ncbi:MAG: hypothetical protein H8F28_03295 [Fibrella sp.]|nr:hypothetical protein [Armatimonadota bacterium]